MTRHKTRHRRSSGQLVVPLLLAVLGIGAVLALYYLFPGFEPIELGLLVLAIVIGVIGYTQTILRAIMTVIIVYIATGVAATFYVTTAPYVGAPFGDQVTDPIRALSFLVLTAAIWIVLEAISRALLGETGLPGLSILDNLGALVIYLAIGVLVASLLFNASGYVPRFRRMHDDARLRPRYNQVISLLYTSQSFWFTDPPRFYVYDLQ